MEYVFKDFMIALHGYGPFPWQERMVDTGFPETIAVPTGTGKTTCLEIWLWLLVTQPNISRRLVFVVDRRIVVSEAFKQANNIRFKLDQAVKDNDTGVLGFVAKRLLEKGGRKPLHVAQWRGGIKRDSVWLENPAQPMIAVSTVDQVGSRLLFRPYGASLKMAPIHAGLLAFDTTLILDEAHISQPFYKTLKNIQKHITSEYIPLPPLKLITMTATPKLMSDKVFVLDKKDYAHSLLSKRLKAIKLAMLDEIKIPFQKNYKKKTAMIVDSFTKLSTPFISDTGTTGIVVNSVGLARGIFDKLKKTTTHDVIILTGRQRPADRDTILRIYQDRLDTKLRDRNNPELRPLILVATQCVEVGADFDFDCLITQCASLEALVQRFGRVNRIGVSANPGKSLIIKITEKKDPTSKEDDYIYGKALDATWAWLKKLGKQIDFGVSAISEQINALPDKKRQAMTTPVQNVPILHQEHLDILSQTMPAPEVLSSDVSLWLHGQQKGIADCSVIWRADLDTTKPESWLSCVDFVRPTAMESLPVPFKTLMSWLSQASHIMDYGDVEGAAIPKKKTALGKQNPPLLVWRGFESSEVVSLSEVVPGDTLILPASYGGVDEWGFNPSSTEPVEDIAEKVKGRFAKSFRYHPAFPWFRENTLSFSALIKSMKKSDIDYVSDWASYIKKGEVFNHPSGKGYVIVREWDTTGEEEKPIITLQQHSYNVMNETVRVCRALGLSDFLTTIFKNSALFHDVGKIDLRFQTILHAGDVAGACADSMGQSWWAKSKGSMDDATRIFAYQVSAMPKGWRHEMFSSVLMAGECGDLQRHLIEVHHGHARPFAPIVLDDNQQKYSVTWEGVELSNDGQSEMAKATSGVADRFFKCQDTYGVYGLAFLEAILRCADGYASKTEGMLK